MTKGKWIALVIAVIAFAAAIMMFWPVGMDTTSPEIYSGS